MQTNSVADMQIEMNFLTIKSLTRDGIICQSKEEIRQVFTAGKAAKRAFCGFFKRLLLSF